MAIIRSRRPSNCSFIAVCTVFIFGSAMVHAGCLQPWGKLSGKQDGCSPSITEASQNHYVFPENISLSLMNFGKAEKNGSFQLKGIMEAKTGTLQKLEIFFESSPDLDISPVREKLESLAEKQKKEFIITAKPAKGKADEMGSWIKMRVKYLPDYVKIRATVQSPAEYPVDIERQRLIEIVEKNFKSSAFQQDAIRFFLK